MFVLFSCLLEVHYAWYCLAFNTPASLCGVCFQPNTASTTGKGWRGRMVRPSLMLSILYPPDLLLFTNHYWNFVSFPPQLSDDFSSIQYSFSEAGLFLGEGLPRWQTNLFREITPWRKLCIYSRKFICGVCTCKFPYLHLLTNKHCLVGWSAGSTYAERGKTRRCDIVP